MLFTLCFLFATNDSLFAQSNPKQFQPGRLFMKVQTGSNLELPTFSSAQERDKVTGFPALMSIYRTYGIEEVHKPFKTQTKEIQQIYQVEYAPSARMVGLLEELSALPYLAYVERVPIYKTFYNPNDYSANNQRGLAKIEPEMAWDITKGDSNVVIAIVDNAIDINHGDLRTEIWVNPGEIANNGLDDDNNGFIDDVNGYDLADMDNDPTPPSSFQFWDHGTSTGSIAGAATDNGSGMASIGFGSKLMACKGAESSTSGESLSDYPAAIDYAIVNHAEVVNLSFGGPNFSQTIQTLIDGGHALGVTFVGAIGNEGLEVARYPASFDHVIGVAATNIIDRKWNLSNYHSTVDVSAPGDNIRVATLPGGFTSRDGTSMSAPFVAGLCGLMLAVDPTLSPDDLEACLKAGADNLDARDPVYIGKIGAGRINAHNTLLCLSGTSRENSDRLSWNGFHVQGAYPNPTHDQLTLRGSFSKPGKLRISVRDLGGQEVMCAFEGTVAAGTFYRDADLQGLPGGVYVAEWDFGGDRKVQRIVRVP